MALDAFDGRMGRVMHNEAFTESWFIRPVPRPRSVESPDEAPRTRKPRGRLGYVLAFGACSGAIGGPLMLLTAATVARRAAIDTDIVGVVGALALRLSGSEDVLFAALVAAIVLGAGLGTAFGLLTRHSVRVVSRALTGAILAPTLWTLAHAFIFKPRFGDSLGALPFGPMLVGATIFGICATILPPPREAC